MAQSCSSLCLSLNQYNQIRELSTISSLPFAGTQIKILVGNEFNSASFSAATSGFEQCGGVYDNIQTGASFHVHCYQTLVGRYVVVQMDGAESQLTVCELEVYQEQGRAMTLSCALQTHTKSLIYNIIKHFQIQILVFQNIIMMQKRFHLRISD